VSNSMHWSVLGTAVWSVGNAVGDRLPSVATLGMFKQAKQCKRANRQSSARKGSTSQAVYAAADPQLTCAMASAAPSLTTLMRRV
jgi:hypothetical protein